MSDVTLPPPIEYPRPTMGDTQPFLVPAGPLQQDPTPSSEWMRAPNCPNNSTDCRITVTFLAVTTPVPPPVHDGTGVPQPPLVVKALPHGDCSVCKLSWDITRMPPGASGGPPVNHPPFVPPTVPPTTP